MTVTDTTLATEGPSSTERQIPHWIDGRETGDFDRSLPVHDPATGAISGRVALASVEDVDAAVHAARAAFLEWRSTPVTRRAAVLFRYREIVDQRRDELARAISHEHGKTLPDAAGEVQRGLEVVEFACGIPQLLKGDRSPNVATKVDTWSQREPLGVVAGITPFNFPAMVPMWMYPVAIACGNSFLLKPSEKDPSASLLMARWFEEAGLPSGVLNVVQGDRIAVDRILEHPDIAAVSFVGSTGVARKIYERAAASGKRVQALGGAKNHMVVLPDADFDLAADAAISAGYGSAGERCMAISVIVTVGDAADRLLPKLRERIDALQVGPASEASSEMGPLITAPHRDRVVGLIAGGIEEGAELVIDGRPIEVEGCEDGFFVGPTLFDRVKPEMQLYREEIFGPVLAVVRCATFQEAVELINANRYANGTAIFTHDGGAAREFEQEIEVGMVGINVPIPVPLAFYSFGGWRDSLFGAQAIYGPEGVHFYTRQKVVTSRWPDPRHRGVDLGFPTTTS